MLGRWLRVTRQEVAYFGTPSGNHGYDHGHLPPWAEFGEDVVYGIPGNEYRGFKIAEDVHGPAFDPSHGERQIRASTIDRLRQRLGRRFPALAAAPLLESRVCQYSVTPDNNFLIDQHPEARNVLLLGGGSGHGFKHGPALGEYVSGLLESHTAADTRFALARSLT